VGSPIDNATVRAWLAAARDPAVVGDLLAVYQMIADQVEARAPVCEASGRCCNFVKTGHLLYVTGLEAAYMATRRRVAPAEVDAARARGDCPFLLSNLCGARDYRPMGCRVYYCDPTAQDWQRDLSERAMGLIRRLHDRHGVEYRYGNWIVLLGLVAPHSGHLGSTPTS
jgi:hypothetical protein